jgi:hypothetical protein
MIKSSCRAIQVHTQRSGLSVIHKGWQGLLKWAIVCKVVQESVQLAGGSLDYAQRFFTIRWWHFESSGSPVASIPRCR